MQLYFCFFECHDWKVGIQLSSGNFFDLQENQEFQLLQGSLLLPDFVTFDFLPALPSWDFYLNLMVQK